MKRIQLSILFILALTMFNGCGGSGVSSSDPDPGNNGPVVDLDPTDPDPVAQATQPEGTESAQGVELGNASGLVQKGPFVSGSSITIQELDEELSPTDTSFLVTTEDDFGSFEIPDAVTRAFVEVVANGFYFNEVSGELSEAGLVLRSVSDLSESSVANVNILTTLMKDRVKYLINEEGADFITARDQAEIEVLSIFSINQSDLLHFDQMDMSQEGDSNAVLIAISAVLQGTNTVAQLSELLSKINLDLETDGILDNATIQEALCETAKNLNLSEVRSNIEDRYAALGLDITVAPFEDYIDSDCDGIVNKGDSDKPYFWKQLTLSLPWEARSGHAVAEFGGRIWVLGGHYWDSSIGQSVYLNDVWASTNGVDWEEITSNAPWEPRYDHAAVVFNGKIWVMGGYCVGCSFSKMDVWYSEDGLHWTQAASELLIDAYSKAVVFDNKLWLVSSSENSPYIWSSPDGIEWTQVSTSPLSNRSYWPAQVLVFDNKMWMVGGEGSALVDNDDIYLSTNGIDWETAVEDGPFGGSSSAGLYVIDCVVLQNKIWIFGADPTNGVYDIYGNNAVWSSVDGFYWTEEKMAAFPWPQRSFPVVVFNDMIWVLGGNEGTASNPKNDVWVYAPYTEFR